MEHSIDLSALSVGYDLPAHLGMAEAEIQTPCLILDLDALERNIRKMGEFARAAGMALRVHGKMHKSVDVARLQHEIGGAQGVCCQKVSEAEAFVRGGIGDVLVSNQVRDPLKIDRLAHLATIAKIMVCVDDRANVAELSRAACRHGGAIHCLVEIDCGAGRCGVTQPAEALAIAREIATAPALSYAGIQAYQGAMQHLEAYAERQSKHDEAMAIVTPIVAALDEAGLRPRIVTGGGTGSFPLESASGIYTELQCGSYAFMDADYGRVRDAQGRRLDAASWENALFILTSIMSTARRGAAVCDAGLKAQSVDSGLPVVFGRDDVVYQQCSDEHGVLSDPNDVLKINEKLRLIPGHCDPTCNIHDWYVGVRGGVVETIWPISARGKSY